MTRLNRKVEYALIALKYMSSKYAGQLTTVKEICGATHIPFDATSRVMQQMTQKNILKAEHGAYGGYLLMRDLSRVSFLEVVEIVTGKVEAVRCMSEESDCELLPTCNVVSPLRVFNQKLQEFYSSLTVADLLQTRDNYRESRDTRTTVEGAP